MELGDVGRIEKAFVEAALDQTLWVRALEIAAAETDGVGASLIPIKGQALPSFPSTESIDGLKEQFFRDGWHLHDLRRAGIPTFLRTGVMDDRDCIDVNAMPRSPYYQEFLAPHGLRWFAGVKIACGDDLWCLTIQKKADRGPLSSAHRRKLSALSRSLSGSAAIARAFAESAVAGALDAFEFSASAVALVNGSGQIYRLNSAAERLLQGEVRVAGRRIICAERSASAALDREIGRILCGGAGAALAPPVALPRFGKVPLLAYASKLSAIASNALAECQAIIIFVDPDSSPPSTQHLLQSCFSLTPAEAKLASRLAAGSTLEQVSEQLEVSKGTSRTHLKSIFDKLGVRRQAELVALLGRLSKIDPQSGV